MAPTSSDLQPEILPGEPPTALRRALRKVLRPLVRLLIARGVTFPALTALLKEIYFDVAERDFPLDGRGQSDSRLSLLTGIHRKEVRRLRTENTEADSGSAGASLHAQLIALWLGGTPYIDGGGKPKPLPRQPMAGGPSFESLVRSVSKDIRPRVVLDEWLRAGVAHLDSDDRVTLDVEAFVPQADFDALAGYFGRNLHDHMAAAAHNLDAGDGRFLERSVYYDRLSAESVAALEALARKHAQALLLEINREAVRLAEEDAGKSCAHHRMNFGTYFYSADQRTEDGARAPRDDSDTGDEE